MVVVRDKRKHTLKVDYSSVAINSIVDSIKQLNPLKLIKNPIMFIVSVCTVLAFILAIKPALFGPTELTSLDNLVIASILFFTVFSSNIAENVARHMGKAQSESLRIVHGDIEVKKVLPDNNIEYVFSSTLEKGDMIRVQEGDLIPLDGEVVEGVATVDE